MKLTKEILEAAVWGYMIATGQEPQEKAQNGFVERSKHQRRRGRPPKATIPKINALKKYTYPTVNFGAGAYGVPAKKRGRPPKKRLGRPPKVAA